MRRSTEVLQRLLSLTWRAMPRGLDWWVLWIANSKFNVGVIGIITNASGQVLLLKHVYRRNENWGLPSGWMHAGETPEQAIIREISEEVGAPVTVDRTILVRGGFRLRLEIVLAGKIREVPVAPSSIEVKKTSFFDSHNLPSELSTRDRELILNATRAL
jgi:8-oxo-dGTP diphosphatase